MRRAAFALLLCSVLAVSAPAAASVTIFDATLTGAQVNPATPSSATGSATVTVNDVLDTVTVNMTFSGLSALATASHIHCCAPPGTNAIAAIPMAGFPSATSGTYSATFDLTNPASWNTAFVTAHGGTTTSAFSYLLSGMLAGDSYINIHDSTYPGGEISGQLAAVPEPSTWALMFIGFGVMGASLRFGRRMPKVEVKT